MRRIALVLASAAITACGDPVAPRLPTDFVEIGAGDGLSCALMRDGRAWCWGAALFGQLGNGTTLPSPVPVEVAGGHRFVTLAVGDTHACATEADGAAWCWGLNDFRELGAPAAGCNGNAQFFSCASRPLRVGGATAFASLVAGGYATCGLTSDGQAWCWGGSTHGQLGVDSLRAVIREPLAVVGAQAFRAITLDQFHACGVLDDGALRCWGGNQYGQLGVAAAQLCGPLSGPFVSCSAAPLVVSGSGSYAAVSAGTTHTCALTPQGGARCWGSNEYGVLGSLTAAEEFAAVSVHGDRRYRGISAGADHSCAVDEAGGAWCWGLGVFGQLGSGAAAPTASCAAFGTSRPCERTPVRVVAEGVRFLAVSAGTSHSCAVSAAGEVWCWGRGTEGQLGDGAAVNRATPVRVAIP